MVALSYIKHYKNALFWYRITYVNALNFQMKRFAFTFNPLPIRIIFMYSDLVLFFQYLIKCDRDGFSGINQYDFMKEREFMYQWHLNEIASKVLDKLQKTDNNKSLNVKFSQIEQKTLLALFKRIDCEGDTGKIIINLKNRFNET